LFISREIGGDFAADNRVVEKMKKSPEEIIALGEELYQSMSECRLCPMDCRVDRLSGELGNCNSPAELKVASYNLHFGEEPPLSGGRGSGTIFLSNCSMFCKYCQNYPISQFGTGSIIDTERMKNMMLELQRRGADNINFVTPDHMLPFILIGLGLAKKEGMNLPIVYNCSGYQKIEILRRLEGIIDVYLVDMRYNDDKIAEEYSGCKNYSSVSRTAVKEMFRQVGNLEADDNDMAVSGVIVRHLVLPNNLSGSEQIFKFLADEVSEDIYISLMSQYFPAYMAVEDKKINRQIASAEFQRAVDAFYEAGLKNGFIQNVEYESV
jgi:putative pyruvate formate lyase activating enzyme